MNPLDIPLWILFLSMPIGITVLLVLLIRAFYNWGKIELERKVLTKEELKEWRESLKKQIVEPEEDSEYSEEEGYESSAVMDEEDE